MEIDLVPEAVARARNVSARRPYLMMAAAVLLGLFGAGIAHYKRATAVTNGELQTVTGDKTELERWDRRIRDAVSGLETDQERGNQLRAAVIDRSFWSDMLGDMNQRLPNDLVWLTAIDPIAGTTYVGAGATPEISGPVRDALDAFFAEAPPPPGPGQRPTAGRSVQKPVATEITKIHVQGLYRDVTGGSGPSSVEAFLSNLTESPFFAIEDLDEVDKTKYMPRLTVKGGGGQWAYPFDFILPLKRPLPLP
jgi:hypothetical protein